MKRKEEKGSREHRKRRLLRIAACFFALGIAWVRVVPSTWVHLWYQWVSTKHAKHTSAWVEPML